MDADSIAIIDASRERLQRFVETVTDDELSRTVEGDWTASALLAHIAFWDRRTTWLIGRCLRGDSSPSPVDLDSVNEAALPQWKLIPPRAAAEDALDAAEETDSLVENLPDDLLTTLREAKINYDRSSHRNAHLDQIEQALDVG